MSSATRIAIGPWMSRDSTMMKKLLNTEVWNTGSVSSLT